MLLCLKILIVDEILFTKAVLNDQDINKYISPSNLALKKWFNLSENGQCVHVCVHVCLLLS